jgi:hypothetical protein
VWSALTSPATRTSPPFAWRRGTSSNRSPRLWYALHALRTCALRGCRGNLTFSVYIIVLGLFVVVGPLQQPGSVAAKAAVLVGQYQRGRRLEVPRHVAQLQPIGTPKVGQPI